MKERELVKESLKSIIKYGDFTLASGKKSKYYIDIWSRCFTPGFLNMVAEAFWKEIVDENFPYFEHVIGPESGASPLISVIIQSAPRWAGMIGGTIIRKQPCKDRYLEGMYIGIGPILLVDDVITTGGSLEKCISVMDQELFGTNPKHSIREDIGGVFCILDRQDDYKLPYPLYSLVKINEILDQAKL